LQRRRAAVVLAALAALACGGGTSDPSPTPTPTPGLSKLVVLDSGTFDELVLAPARPSLVKFQSPT
jgi:hypothetical protein